MKLFSSLIISALLLLAIGACEKIVEPDLETATPRLVVDARVNLFKNQPSNYQQVKLSLSKPFYQAQVDAATGAQVSVSDGSGNTFAYTESGNSGVYEQQNFTPTIGETYTLIIDYGVKVIRLKNC